MAPHTASQSYLSTRGGTYGATFEEVVLQGLAPDGGLFIPEEIPALPSNWQTEWRDYSFEELAFEILSLYVSRDEVPHDALRDIIRRSYATFRVPEVTPTLALDQNRKIYLLELFHGQTFAFKDVALQFLGNLFEFFLVRKNEGKTAKEREHLTVIGATSGDTGSAAIYGLRGKKDVDIFITYPLGGTSRIQELQMTTVADENVHCLRVDGTFDDCQDFVKALFADSSINKTQRLAAVNSINWARILAQITYYFSSYFSLIRSGTFNPSSNQIRFVVPTGNFGDILAGYFAKRMGLPIDKLIIATNENDILHRFWQTGAYEKQSSHDSAVETPLAVEGQQTDGGGVKRTYSPAMDILVSSNFERLLWFIAFDVYGGDAPIEEKRRKAGLNVKEWQTNLKSKGGFSVEKKVLEAAKTHFSSERVSNEQTLDTIREVYRWPNTPGDQHYVLDPHSAIGVAAALRSVEAAPNVYHVPLATAHPAKFSEGVEKALKDEKDFRFTDILPEQFFGLEDLEQRIVDVRKSDGLDGLRKIILREVKTR